MAHTLQERYSKLVDAKLRATLVKKNGVIFNTRYEGTPTAGAVKIPIRDTEAAVVAYDKGAGAETSKGTTTYLTIVVDKDYAVNELIDGHDAASVPDNLAADRLDSAGYSLALQMDTDGTACLEGAATVYGDTTAVSKDNVYTLIVGVRTTMSKAKVPNDGKRFLLVSPDVYAALLEDTEHFIRSTSLGDAVVQTGAVGKVAGFLVFEDVTLSGTTDFIAGHPDWCARVEEWQVPVHIQDLSGSGKYIGASAVQGRKVYAHKVTKPATLYIKKHAAS